jgi:hypothetical protein
MVDDGRMDVDAIDGRIGKKLTDIMSSVVG